MDYSIALTEIFNRIPRRHSADNVKDMQLIMSDYEALLIEIEGVNTWYEEQIPPFFDTLESVRAGVKKSTDNKASKKSKDDYFDQAASLFKDSVQELLEVYAQGEEG